MIANYHVHTARCRHAVGADEEYVKKAIAEGIKILGFSDHAPCLYPCGYESYYKMTPDEAPEYFNSISGLREKYRDKIKIYIGYEAEYYPSIWDRTLEFWASGKARPEYLLLGQHYAEEEYTADAVHSADGTDSEAALTLYVDNVIKAIRTGRFTYIAHPDIFNFFGDVDFYRAEMTRLILASKEEAVPLEINLLGMRAKRNYPTSEFWQIASRHGMGAVLGVDAHGPDRVADKDEILAALRFADRHGIEIIENVTLKDPFFDMK